MRSRFPALVPLVLLVLLVASACSGIGIGQAPAEAPQPTKTLRPTFTPGPAGDAVVIAATSTRRPTMTLTAAPVEEPTAEPTAAATPQPVATEVTVAKITVKQPTLNVRGGPGTNYPVLGKVQQGEQFEITGKNPDGSWWQFNYQGKSGWVIGTMVEANEAAGSVQVAANIPPAPTAPPRPTAAPAPPAAPQPPPATSYQFAAVEWSPFLDTNPWVTILCKVSRDQANGIAGTIRVLQGGNPVAEKTFEGGRLLQASWAGTINTKYIYNSGCKVELRPAVEGSYSAYLVGPDGSQVSEPMNFTVSGDMHEIVLSWRPK